MLKDKMAVSGCTTRGAGRGLACMMVPAGAIIYCTGRSVRSRPASGSRPETVGETVEMVAPTARRHPCSG